MCERGWTSREVGNDTQEGDGSANRRSDFIPREGRCPQGVTVLCACAHGVQWVVSPRLAPFYGRKEHTHTRLSLIQSALSAQSELGQLATGARGRSVHQIGPRHCILSAVTAVPGLPLATLRTWVGLLGALAGRLCSALARAPSGLPPVSLGDPLLPLLCHSFAVRLSFALAHRTHLLLPVQTLSRAP